MNDKIPCKCDDLSLNEIREITMKFLRGNTPLITDAVFNRLDETLTELRDEAVQQYKSNEKFKELITQNNELMAELVSKLPENVVKLFDECMEAKNKWASIELDFVYRKGLQDSILLLQYIGFPFFENEYK